MSTGFKIENQITIFLKVFLKVGKKRYKYENKIPISIIISVLFISNLISLQTLFCNAPIVIYLKIKQFVLRKRTFVPVYTVYICHLSDFFICLFVSDCGCFAKNRTKKKTSYRQVIKLLTIATIH